MRTPVGRVAAVSGFTSIFTDVFSIFTSNDGSSETTAKALFWSTITPFGLNKTGDFSEAASTRIGTLISYEVKQNNEKGTK
ncbi:hypothetical protein ABFY09_10565 [Marinomonas sp. 5E14-1]|uniref:hypothetical protein n=1 Tax=Marinomonas sp. 5E14-1 TaxID=3153922 RepID=UPI003266C2A8